MNPNTRRLVKITIKDAEQAEAILTACMGKDTTPRKKLILDREGVDVVWMKILLIIMYKK